jgi:hypothetical protein
MRELVSELTPRAGPALSLSRGETPRAVLCVVCVRAAAGVSLPVSDSVSLTCSIAMGGGRGVV